MKMSKNELIEILGVTKETLKKIEQRNQLEKRLNDLGYKFIGKTKEGRTVMYEIEKEDNNKELLNNIIKYCFNTTNYEQFSKYLLYRIYNLGQPITKELIAKRVGVSRKTITEWDKQLIEHNFIGKDGYWYVRKEISEEYENYVITDEWEYNSYSENMKYIEKEKKLYDKLEDNEIDELDYKIFKEGMIQRKEAVKGKFIYKVKKFFKKNQTQLCTDMIRLIRKVYTIDFREYYMPLIK